MKRNLLLLAGVIVGVAFSGNLVFGALQVFDSEQTGASPTDGYILQTDGTDSTWVATSTLGIGGGTVTSVDMSVPTGLAISGNPITTSGTLALTYDTGYAGVLTASTTNWNNFFDTPSTQITAGTGLSWAGNTLSATGGGGSNWTIVSGEIGRAHV